MNRWGRRLALAAFFSAEGWPNKHIGRFPPGKTDSSTFITTGTAKIVWARPLVIWRFYHEWQSTVASPAWSKKLLEIVEKRDNNQYNYVKGR